LALHKINTKFVELSIKLTSGHKYCNHSIAHSPIC
jgi:hypothetical protein